LGSLDGFVVSARQLRDLHIEVKAAKNEQGA